MYMKYFSKKYLSVILGYIAVLIGTLYLFPLQNKLGFYYQLNKPWQYNNLIAPFDFPIYKTDAEIKAEKDSIIVHFFPYVENKQNTKDEVIEKIQSITNNFFAGDNSEETKKFLIDFYEFTSTLIDSIYNVGIISQTDLKEIKSDTVIVISGAYMKKTPLSNLLTQERAAKICTQKTEQFLKKIDIKHKNNLLYELDYYKNLKPNLIYNAGLSEKELKNRLETVSYTTGMIQKGELIIAKGNLITPEKIRILNSLKREYESQKNSFRQKQVVTGYLILLLIILLINFIFTEFKFGKHAITLHILYLSLLVLFGTLAFFVGEYSHNYVYLLPFSLIPIVFKAFFDEETAIFYNISIILFLSILTYNPYEFILYNITTGIIVILSMKNFTARSHFVKTSFLSFLTLVLIYTAFNLIQGNSLQNLRYTRYIILGISSILLLLSYSFIYLIERVFGLLSDISLIELTNTNKPLLQRLSEDAPGTFQHSIQVANLASNVASKIGADSLLVKAGAFYHDIGKLRNPGFFTENQHKGFDAHKELDPLKSATIIIGHVTEGVALAKEHKLPSQIIDFIITHHGTSRVEYFYHKYKKQQGEEKAVKNEHLFRYPGPKPFNKETAILMMCDAVEAASRSLDDYTAESIGNLVDKIIDSQFKNGQFDYSNLTLQEISQAKSILKAKLQNIYHTRVKYPE